MNKIFLSLVAAMFTFQSCDNYLDLTPKGESLLTSTTDYLGLIEELTPSYPIGNFWYMSSEATLYKIVDLDDYADPLKSAAFFWDESVNRAQHTNKDELYENCYARIARYNIIIENILSSEGKESDKLMGLAQAKIMRAYNYFFLINTFAKFYNPQTASTDNGIILHTKFDLEAKGVQESVQAAYDLIEQDIEESLADLPEVSQNTFRPSKAFGYGLKAKVHLYKGEFEEAIAAAKTAIADKNHRLWDMNDMYEEVLAANPMLETMPSMWGFYASFSNQDSEHLLYQFGLNHDEPAPNYVRKEVMDLYDKKSDIRYITCFAYYMPDRPTAEPGAIMYSGRQVSWNIGGIRLSDVYLILAEAYARTGATENAMNTLNQLRERRLLREFYQPLTAATPDEAFKYIREERKRELVLTYNGFFDMKRYSTQLNETFEKVFVNSKGETKTYSVKPNSPLYVYPFPINAMQTSNLEQNTK